MTLTLFFHKKSLVEIIYKAFGFCLRIIKSNLIKTNINILKDVKANMFRKTTEKNHRSI